MSDIFSKELIHPSRLGDVGKTKWCKCRLERIPVCMNKCSTCREEERRLAAESEGKSGSIPLGPESVPIGERAKPGRKRPRELRPRRLRVIHIHITRTSNMLKC